MDCPSEHYGFLLRRCLPHVSQLIFRLNIDVFIGLVDQHTLPDNQQAWINEPA